MFIIHNPSPKHNTINLFMGAKTMVEFTLKSMPSFGSSVWAIERCSGHDGTYAVKTETHDIARKIARPVVNRVQQADPDTFGSDCPMAGRLIADGLDAHDATAEHPISMARRAYGI